MMGLLKTEKDTISSATIMVTSLDSGLGLSIRQV